MKGYHYTTPAQYKGMIDGQSGLRDARTVGQKGLIPTKPFRWNGAEELPAKGREFVIEALLELEPRSWTHNPEFPNIWDKLMDSIWMKADIFKDPEMNKIMLLSFELEPTDQAFVVDWAHMERFYSKKKKIPIEEAVKKYWESRVPAQDYTRDSFSIPMLVIWNSIDLERITIEWTKKADHVWYPRMSFGD